MAGHGDGTTAHAAVREVTALRSSARQPRAGAVRSRRVTRCSRPTISVARRHRRVLLLVECGHVSQGAR